VSSSRSAERIVCLPTSKRSARSSSRKRVPTGVRPVAQLSAHGSGDRALGESGRPVLLLPGGAESCDGFFPGLPEGLVADPGAQVIVHDRPGTGTSTVDGSLVDRLSPATTPSRVAGLVLLDPTPINDPRTCAGLERVTVALGRLAGRRTAPSSRSWCARWESCCPRSAR
jgi:pimeloyl-ACP methyl ester carboxylesterase